MFAYESLVLLEANRGLLIKPYQGCVKQRFFQIVFMGVVSLLYGIPLGNVTGPVQIIDA